MPAVSHSWLDAVHINTSGLWLQTKLLCAPSSDCTRLTLVFTAICAYQVRNPSNHWIVGISLRYFISVGNKSALAPSFHLLQWPVLRCCLHEGAGLDRTLERQFPLLLVQLETLALSNPWHTFPPQPKHTAYVQVGPGVPPPEPCHWPWGTTNPGVPPAPSSCEVSPSRSSRAGDENPATAPALRQSNPWHWGWTQCQAAAGAVLGISWKQELPL